MSGRKGVPHRSSPRGLCPKCGKKGLKQEELIPTGINTIGVCCIQTCQYCQAQRKRWYRNGSYTEPVWS